MDLKSFKHAFGQNAFHFVWKCKYARDPMKFYGVRMDCEFFIRQAAYRNGFKIYELHIAVDHIHLFVEMPTTMSVSKALQLFKGYSAFKLLQKHPWLRNYFTKGHFWSPGKFFRSVGNTTSEAVKHYIASSQPWTDLR
ncbi:IS200/IS605 family transposase [Candidatus Pacearchaeota archaeon]|nr:IS200/IS605 family transposase [Candidatus Pacearchaeota archaeon]